MGMQSLLGIIYPNGCLTCDAPLGAGQSLCGSCWKDTVFINGLVCDTCGTPLPGATTGEIVHCDDCITLARPWDHGRAALVYSGNGRRIVLALKHGDRQELALPAARWMVAAADDILAAGAVIVPVPAHWTRLVKRRYNQAATLAQAVARECDRNFLPQALHRPKPTKVHDGMGQDARFANMAGAIVPHGRYGPDIAGKPVILVDDVMTSGATLAAATDACKQAGATHVSVLVLARVAKKA